MVAYLFKVSSQLHRIKTYGWCLAFFWAAFISGSLIINLNDVTKEIHTIAHHQALANFNKDLAIRHWAASHGGVYVPVDEVTPPNPHLATISGRDVEINGKAYTLMNPAYMIRQMNERFAQEYGITGHITSLNPLRPENTPDEWERQALKSFEDGTKEKIAFTTMDGKQVLRLIRPLKTKESCLKCHAHQGYKVGDIRGGVGVTLPIDDLLEIGDGRKQKIIIWHLLLMCLGLSCLYLGTSKLLKKTSEKEKTSYDLRERVKELKCLYTLGALIDQKNLSVEEILQEAVQIIPSAYQYPDTTSAQIILNDQTYNTDNFEKTDWLQAQDIFVKKNKVGSVEVAYLAEMPEEYEGPFLMEERKLLDAFAERVGNFFEQKKAEVALRKSKEEWEKTFEAIGDIATILDSSLRILRVNQKACEEFNAKPDELIGKFCHEIFHGETEHCQGCPVVQSVKDLRIHSAEISHEKMGKTFLVSASPVVDSDGEISSVVHFAKDITEQKKLEKRLGQAQKMEAIGTLAGGIAHDFNNILAPILGYADMALGDISPDSTTASDIKEVLKAGKRAKDLVKQILAFSRQDEHELQPLRVQLVAKEALKLLRASIPTTIEVKQNIDPECGAVLADPTQIHQIFMNLCTNAYHAMRETGGVLGVALAPVELGPDDLTTKMDLLAGIYVQLAVSDSGCGMDKIVLERIFDPYYTTKAKGEGTGLGLSVVHGIVKKLHGDITVYSEPGLGTTFHVYFPVTETGVGKRVEEEVAERLPAGNEHILVVDDEEMIVNMEKQMLSSLGYQVSHFTNCEEALKAFRTQPNTFDLIITDMTMPKITGLQLTEEVLAVRSDIPVILCTGFSELINEEKAKDAGIRRYLMKPLLKRDLAIAVREVLDQNKS